MQSHNWGKEILFCIYITITAGKVNETHPTIPVQVPIQWHE